MSCSWRARPAFSIGAWFMLHAMSGCSLLGYDQAAGVDATQADASGSSQDAAEDHDELALDGEAGTLLSDAAVVCTDPMRCNYDCPKGATNCELVCLDSRECISKCTANALCRTTCQGAEHCHVECPPYSSCEVVCRGSAECQPHCADNSICHVTCIDNDCRGVACDPKADCSMTCLGTSKCEFMRCDQPNCVGEQTSYCGGSHSCVAP